MSIFDKWPSNKNPLRGMRNLSADERLNKGNVHELLEAHPGRHEAIYKKLLKDDQRGLLAESFGSFLMPHRLKSIQEIIKKDSRVLEIAIQNVGAYLDEWRAQGRPYSPAQALRLGNYLYACLNSVQDDIDYAEKDKSRDEYEDRGWEPLEGETTFTLGMIIMARLDERYPGISDKLNVESTLKDFEDSPKR